MQSFTTRNAITAAFRQNAALSEGWSQGDCEIFTKEKIQSIAPKCIDSGHEVAQGLQLHKCLSQILMWQKAI